MSEYLNAVALDESTGAITMGVGATGWFRVDLGAGPFDADNTVGVFAVAERVRADGKYTYVNLFRREYPLTLTEEGIYTVLVRLANEDTRTIAPGSYVWTLILVTDPDRDEAGEVIVDERSDGVYPLWTGQNQPKFALEGVAHVITGD